MMQNENKCLLTFSSLKNAGNEEVKVNTQKKVSKMKKKATKQQKQKQFLDFHSIN